MGTSVVIILPFASLALSLLICFVTRKKVDILSSTLLALTAVYIIAAVIYNTSQVSKFLLMFYLVEVFIWCLVVLFICVRFKHKLNTIAVISSIVVAALFIIFVRVGSSELPAMDYEYNDTLYQDVIESEEVLQDNLYRISSYTEVIDSSGKTVYYVNYVEVEQPYRSEAATNAEKLNELIELVQETPFSYASSVHLKDGVNCQTMAVYIVDWCKLNGLVSTVHYADNHVYTEVSDGSRTFKIDFNYVTSITEVQNNKL